MFGLGMTEMIIVGIVAVLLFGSRLPSVARQLGSAIPSFKMGIKDVEKEIKEVEQEIKENIV